mgnify:CR=1 FL=1
MAPPHLCSSRRQQAARAEQQLTQEQVLHEYASSLQQQAAAEAAVANPGTASAAAAAVSEFTAWLQARSPARGVTLQTCAPIDISVYITTSWLPAHGSLLLDDGEVHAAPSYLENTISHLSTFFKNLGREGDYDYGKQVSLCCTAGC